MIGQVALNRAADPHIPPTSRACWTITASSGAARWRRSGRCGWRAAYEGQRPLAPDVISFERCAFQAVTRFTAVDRYGIMS